MGGKIINNMSILKAEKGQIFKYRWTREFGAETEEVWHETE